MPIAIGDMARAWAPAGVKIRATGESPKHTTTEGRIRDDGIRGYAKAETLLQKHVDAAAWPFG